MVYAALFWVLGSLLRIFSWLCFWWVASANQVRQLLACHGLNYQLSLELGVDEGFEGRHFFEDLIFNGFSVIMHFKGFQQGTWVFISIQFYLISGVGKSIVYLSAVGHVLVVTFVICTVYLY